MHRPDRASHSAAVRSAEAVSTEPLPPGCHATSCTASAWPLSGAGQAMRAAQQKSRAVCASELNGQAQHAWAVTPHHAQHRMAPVVRRHLSRSGTAGCPASAARCLRSWARFGSQQHAWAATPHHALHLHGPCQNIVSEIRNQAVHLHHLQDVSDACTQRRALSMHATPAVCH